MVRSEICLTMKEIDRLKTIQAVVDGHLTASIAAGRLGLSTRQVYRLVDRYRASGPLGLRSRLVGRASNHQLPAGVKERAYQLIAMHYPDFGPTLACEKLAEQHGINLAKETIRQMMIASGLWLPRRQRAPKVQQPRVRRACLGELVQIDGCDHRWFEERGPACTAIVFVDDATSRIMAMRFVESESTLAYFETLRDYLLAHGKPQALYSDKASVFRINKQGINGDGQTQFSRALDELNIDGMCANTSSAKGRVERAHLTLQDRLVKELRLQGIDNMVDANTWLPSFLEGYNQRFGKAPLHDFNVHRAIDDPSILDKILVWKEYRRVSKRLSLQYDKRLYMLEDTPEQRGLIGREISVFHYPSGQILLVDTHDRELKYTIYDKLPVINQGEIVENKRLGHALLVAKAIQAKRDNARSRSAPSTPGVNRRRARVEGQYRPRELSEVDYLQALQEVNDSFVSIAESHAELASVKEAPLSQPRRS
ncbi:TPA: ISNCY family transposase [Aeromonas hydrophila]